MTTIVLAAGLSERMGKNKLLLPFMGEAIIAITVKNALSFSDRVIVVVGNEQERIRKALLGANVDFVFNKNYKEGQRTSALEGVKAVEDDDFSILPGDLPLLKKEDAINSIGLLVKLYEGTNTGILMVGLDQYNPAPLYGSYINSGHTNLSGFFVTDTYLKSEDYLNNAGFVKKTGDTMTGDLSMNSRSILNVGALSFGTEENGSVSVVATKDSENGYSFTFEGSSTSNPMPVQIRNIAEPTNDDSAINLAYLKQYCEGKTQEVTLTGVVDTILAHNTEYTIKDFTALTLVCDSAKTAENHGYIKFPNVRIVPTLTGFSKIDGDDITQVAANETWEFSCFKGYMLFKNWGVSA